jgi:hypothetical protein
MLTALLVMAVVIGVLLSQIAVAAAAIYLAYRIIIWLFLK